MLNNFFPAPSECLSLGQVAHSSVIKACAVELH